MYFSQVNFRYIYTAEKSIVMKNSIFTLLLLYCSVITLAQAPRVAFGTLEHDGPYDRSEILLQERLNVVASSDAEYEIISYHATIYTAKSNPIRFKVVGAVLPVKLQGALNQVVAGDSIILNEILLRYKASDLTYTAEKLILKVRKSPYNGLYEDAYTTTDFNDNTSDNLTYAKLGDLETNGIPIEKDVILNQEKITVYDANGLHYEVTSFKMIIAYKHQPAIMMSSNTNLLTERMKESLAVVKSGDRILIEAIKASTEVNSETYRVNLSPIVHTIK